MTAPISAGYPDYARFMAGAQVLEVNQNRVNFTTPVQYPIRYVGNGTYLFLECSASQAVRISVQFWADFAGTIPLDTYTIDAQGVDVARQVVPLLSSYASFLVTPVANVLYQFQLQVWRTSSPGYPAGKPIEPSVFSFNGAAIAASHTTLVDCTNVQEGPAYWSSFVTGGTYKVEIQAVDYQGNAFDLDAVDQNGPARTNRTIWLPPMHIRASVTNFNAGAQTFDLYMTRAYNYK